MGAVLDREHETNEYDTSPAKGFVLHRRAAKQALR
jgi:hypothetical protein